VNWPRSESANPELMLLKHQHQNQAKIFPAGFQTAATRAMFLLLI
jgi:hypothetical protein